MKKRISFESYLLIYLYTNREHGDSLYRLSSKLIQRAWNPTGAGPHHVGHAVRGPERARAGRELQRAGRGGLAPHERGPAVAIRGALQGTHDHCSSFHSRFYYNNKTKNN